MSNAKANNSRSGAFNILQWKYVLCGNRSIVLDTEILDVKVGFYSLTID